MRFGAWNVRSLDRAGSFTAAARELARHKLDLVSVQEVTWDKGGMLRAGDYKFFYGKEKKIIRCEKVFLYTTEQHQHLGERPKRKWEDNINMDLQEVGYEDMV